MSKQSTSPSGLRRRGGWKLPLAALVAAGLILGAQGLGIVGNLASTLHDKDSGSASEAAAGPQEVVDGSIAEFEAVLADGEAEAQGRIGDARGRAASAQADLEARIAELRARFDAAKADAEARADGALSDAKAEVDGVAAAAPFPALPEDYLPGAPVDVPAVQVDAFGLPTFGADGLGDFAATPWDALPADLPVDSGVVPETGEEGVDGAAGAANGAYQTAKKAFLDNSGGSDDPTVQEQIDSLRMLWNDVASDAGPFPLDGGSDADPFSVLERADEMAEPDETGAELAKTHAVDLLGTGDFVLDQRIAGLDAVIDSHYDIVSLIQGELISAQSEALTAEADIIVELEERLAAALAEADAKEAQLNRRVDALTSEAQTSAESAQADLESRLEAEADGLRAEADSVAGELEGEAKGLITESQVKQAQIQALAKEGLGELQALEAADKADYSAYADELIAQAIGAEKRLWKETYAKTDALASEAEAIRGEAEAKAAEIEGRAGAAKADVQSHVAKVQSELEARHAYAVELVRAESETFVAAHSGAADAAIDELSARLEAHKKSVLDDAFAYQDKAEGWVGEAKSLAETVGTKSDAYVGADIDYILQVAEDYAVHDQTSSGNKGAEWQDVANDLSGELDGVLADAFVVMGSPSVAGKADLAEQELGTTRAALESLLLTL